jgi:hypothetical protein
VVGQQLLECKLIGTNKRSGSGFIRGTHVGSMPFAIFRCLPQSFY